MAAIAPCDVGMMTSKHNIYRGTYSGGAGYCDREQNRGFGRRGPERRRLIWPCRFGLRSTTWIVTLPVHVPGGNAGCACNWNVRASLLEPRCLDESDID